MGYLTPSHVPVGDLPDHWIRVLAKEHGMITPYLDECVRELNGLRRISYGLSCAGYDVTCSPKFLICKRSNTAILDPKDPDPDLFEEVTTDMLIMQPGDFVLASTKESFIIPQDVRVVCYSKSTYARVGLLVETTPINPGQTGHITLELKAGAPVAIPIYAHEGIAQFAFSKMASPPEVPYDKWGGKYMNQPEGPVLPRI